MFGTDDIIGLVANIGGKVFDRIFPDPAAATAAKLELFKMTQTGELAQLAAQTDLMKGQLAVNQVEGANTNLFVAGWRPFIGWICGSGLGFQFIVRPLLVWGTTLAGLHAEVPSLDLSTLLTLLMGMLGLGAMRTAEKLQGKA